MAKEVLQYWNQQAKNFDAIYTGEKPAWSRWLDQALRKDMYERFNWTMQQLGDVHGKTICDLGCGTGRYVIACGLGGARRVVGVDGAATMVEGASRLIAANGITGNCEVTHCDVLKYAPDEQFDATLAIGLFDYVKDPVPVLRNARRITTGKFLATFPVLCTWRMPIRKVRLSVLGCPVFFYTPAQIKNALAAAGFACERIDRLGAIYCVVAAPVVA